MSRQPIGGGSIHEVLTDPVKALMGAEIKAFADEHGRVTFDPDVHGLPPQLVNGHGQWDVPSYVALLAEVVRIQARQIDALMRIVPRMDPPSPTPPAQPEARHAAPPEWSSPQRSGGSSWPVVTPPSPRLGPVPAVPPPPPSSPGSGPSPAPSR